MHQMIVNVNSFTLESIFPSQTSSILNICVILRKKLIKHFKVQYLPTANPETSTLQPKVVSSNELFLRLELTILQKICKTSPVTNWTISSTLKKSFMNMLFINQHFNFNNAPMLLEINATFFRCIKFQKQWKTSTTQN